MKEKIQKAFTEKFGREPFITITTPGRANLIGEHIDYQGGYVLPVGVDRFIFSCGRKRKDNKIKLFSFNYNQYFETDTEHIIYQKKYKWANYILGVLEEYKKIGYEISGMEIAIGGNIPVGSGLSSSAAVEISIAVLFQKITGIEIEPLELIKLARRAENEFVGVSCGIMDQFSIYLSKKDNALLINCKTLEYKYAPLLMNGLKFLLVDTKKERSLSSSVYNSRVASVKEAVMAIRQYRDIEFLTDLDDITLYKDKLSEETYKRALHIVEENKRVLDAVSCLEKNDFNGFGQLMYQSHKSLKDLYEVSCEELDFIVGFGKNIEGVKGARLTGAGMGGCALVLLEENIISQFISELTSLYKKTFGINPEFYLFQPVDGALYQNP
ncbi:MAG: galactokinase [Candidatus Omnitrophica bacterium]|nr:galactokinase [Candidatus Omnitrophota bacterium]MCM8778098.1 galactokinase [Candidatus Omnitrophota bacterium]